MRHQIIFFLFVVLFIHNVQAQSALNIPEEHKESAKEKYVLLTDNFNAGNYTDAFVALNWITEHVPDMHISVYVMGQKIIKKLLEQDGELSKEELKEQLMALYDKRINYFGNAEFVLKRKAFDAYRYYRNDADKIEFLAAIFDDVFARTGGDMKPNMLYSYFDVKTKQKIAGKLNDTLLLEIYGKVSEELLRKADQSANPEEILRIQELVDKRLLHIVKLNCGDIRNLFVDGAKKEGRMNEHRAKLVFKLAIVAGCKEEDYYNDAIRVIHSFNPKIKFARILAYDCLEKKNYDDAVEYLNQALSLTNDSLKMADIYFDMATVYYSAGEKEKAREKLYKTLQLNPAKKASYTLLGDLYYGSYHECLEGKSRVHDRAVFYAAYEKYLLGKNVEKMNLAQQQFPTMGEIHQENYVEGQSIRVKCWINEIVKVRRRPKLALN